MKTLTSDGIPIGDGPREKPLRQEVMRLLGAMPGLIQTMREAHVQDGFRVIMTGDNAHLFKQGADGFYKPFLREGGKFVENVDLAKIAPDYSKFATDLAVQVQMAAIMAKLDRIEQAVEIVNSNNQDAIRNNVGGTITALNVARNLTIAQERRDSMLTACNDATTALKVLAGQLKSNIKAMPSETTSVFEGFFSNKLKDAQRAFDAVAADMAMMATGCKDVLRAYEDLGERAAARVAFASFLNDIETSGLEAAARKARLAPGVKGKPAPETLVGWFMTAAKDLDGHLLNNDQGGTPLAICMDISLEELECQP